MTIAAKVVTCWKAGRRRVLFDVRRELKQCSRSRAFHQTSTALAGGGGGDYLHETTIPTYHFQDSLPKLKVPALEKTIDRFLASAEPLCSETEIESARADAAAFRDGDGKVLQEELKAIDAAKYSSFISEPWFDMYLESRDALMLNVNPQLTFKDDPRGGAYMGQTERAAAIVASSVRFYRTMRDEKLKPEIFETKPQRSSAPWFQTLISLIPRSLYPTYAAIGLAGAYPLDMSQYSSLFSSTRVPKEGRDELVKYREKDSRHVIVQCGPSGRMYAVTVLNEDGSAVPAADIAARLRECRRDSESWGDSGAPIGCLTAAGRDDWAAARADLLFGDNEMNAAALHKVDSALFALCLDPESPSTVDELTRHMLHGRAGRNRWFDKSFQLIVCKNGKAAINFEHSWGDGVAVLRYFNEVYSDSTARDEVAETAGRGKQGEGSAESRGWEEVKWDLSKRDLDNIARAEAGAAALVDSVDLKVVDLPRPSTRLLKWLKERKLSPDGFLQMAFQAAHHKMYGESAATYESANTAAFKHGRTETNPQLHAKVAHVLHLFALRTLAEKKEKNEGAPVPAIFKNNAYMRQNNIVLSTSTLSSPSLDGGGFGPVGPECYGIGYGITDDGCRFSVMSYKRETERFAKCLEDVLGEMRDCVDENMANKKD